MVAIVFLGACEYVSQKLEESGLVQPPCVVHAEPGGWWVGYTADGLPCDKDFVIKTADNIQVNPRYQKLEADFDAEFIRLFYASNSAAGAREREALNAEREQLDRHLIEGYTGESGVLDRFVCVVGVGGDGFNCKARRGIEFRVQCKVAPGLAKVCPVGSKEIKVYDNDLVVISGRLVHTAGVGINVSLSDLKVLKEAP